MDYICLNVPPRKERPSPHAIKLRVDQLLELIQLNHVTNQFPAQLSKQQKQRVALAQALAVESRILF